MKQGRQAILYQTDYAEVTTPDSERQPPCPFVGFCWRDSRWPRPWPAASWMFMGVFPARTHGSKATVSGIYSPHSACFAGTGTTGRNRRLDCRQNDRDRGGCGSPIQHPPPPAARNKVSPSLLRLNRQ
jgi:hypothetical protein